MAKSGKPEGITPDGSMKARKWFREEAKDITYLNVNDFMKGSKNEKRMVRSLDVSSIGSMYMFFYDAKLKEELPYWDRFPLIFPIEFYRNDFLAINLHYLNHSMRARLMDALHTITNNKKYDETTKLRINYKILKSFSKFSAFRPCVKKYLNNHIRSNFLYVQPKEWDMALLLPTERFVGAGKGRVWGDSIQKIK